jgi:hypothetical protein
MDHQEKMAHLISNEDSFNGNKLDAKKYIKEYHKKLIENGNLVPIDPSNKKKGFKMVKPTTNKLYSQIYQSEL